MRRSRAAGVADASDDLSRTDRLAERHGNAALFQMCKQNPRAPASKHHVIARRMGAVHRGWRVIGQLALTLLDSSLARADDDVVEDGVVAQARWREAARAAPECVEPNDVDRVLVGWKPMMKWVERHAVPALNQR